MSRYCGDKYTKPILDAAKYWREAALIGEGSVFTSKRLWTNASLEALDELIVKNPDVSNGSFWAKLEQQLAPAIPDAKQLASEMFWVLYLCPSSLTSEHKRRSIELTWTWSGESFPSGTPWLSDEVLSGIGSAGPGFNQNQWRELVFLINLVRRFRMLDPDQQRKLLSDGWAFDEWLKQIPDWESRQFRHMLLFLLFPDNFERIFGQLDRKTVVRHYSTRDKSGLRGMDPLQLDHELYAIRKRLEDERGTHELDYYIPPLRDEWKNETFSNATELITETHVLSALAEIDSQGVPADAQSTGYDLIYGGKSYPPKLVVSLAVKALTGEPLDPGTFSGGESSPAFRFLRRLGFDVKPKRAGVSDVAELLDRFLAQAQGGVDLGVQDYIKEYRGLKVAVSFGKGNVARIPWIAFLGRGQTVSKGIYPVLLLFKDQRRLLLCNGISEENASDLPWGDLPGKLTVREWFQQQYTERPKRYGLSFVHASYDVDQPLPIEDLQRELDQMIGDYTKVLAAPTVEQLIREEVDPEPLKARMDIRASVAAFSAALDASGVRFGDRHETIVASFVASLVTKPLVILTGLSGSGKTQIAIRFGEWLGKDRLYVAVVRPDWSGAEALFGYEDALKPAKEGEPAWSVPGPLEFMLKAARDPQHPYLLVLDEMNLAHVERYFADVLSGMESKHPCLPNVRKGSDGCWRINQGDEQRLTFPRNLFIVGTVNVDETTYMFSPKVLDRANTFEFRVNTADLLVSAHKPVPCTQGELDLVRGIAGMASDDDWHSLNPASSIAQVTEHMRHLHVLLSNFNLEFGHRVFYEAIRFASLAERAGMESLESILDAIVMQKILPRLHGSRKRLELPLLALARFCRDLSVQVEPNELLVPVHENNAGSTEARLPTSYGKLVRMLQSLRTNQFASFTE
jgi:5-methylcytosine-specific restriction protein B